MSAEAKQRKRIEDLEAEINALKEPIEQTLMDMREILASIDNPVNIIMRGIEPGAPRDRPRPHQDRKEDVRAPGESHPATAGRLPPVNPRADSLSGLTMKELMDVRTFNIYACTSFLCRLIGRPSLEKLLYSFQISFPGSSVIRQELESAIDYFYKVIQRNESFIDTSEISQASVNEHLLAITILGMLLRYPDDPLLGSLAVFLGRLVPSSPIERR